MFLGRKSILTAPQKRQAHTKAKANRKLQCAKLSERAALEWAFVNTSGEQKIWRSQNLLFEPRKRFFRFLSVRTQKGTSFLTPWKARRKELASRGRKSCEKVAKKAILWAAFRKKGFGFAPIFFPTPCLSALKDTKYSCVLKAAVREKIFGAKLRSTSKREVFDARREEKPRQG